MATRMQQRRGTAAQWTAANPTLAAGEIGFETDTNQFKIGNGSSAWSALSYFKNLDGLDGVGGIVTLNAQGMIDIALIPQGVALDAELTQYIEDHNNETTGVHGISNTANLVYQTDLTTTVNDAISLEVNNRNDAISDAIGQEVTNRNTAIDDAIALEVTERNTAINDAIALEVSARDVAIDDAIAQEVTDRNNAIGNEIAAEVSDRNQAIDDAIAQEVTDRNNAIGTEIGTHNSDTTGVHGITDTAALATKTYADNAASAVGSSASANLTAHTTATTSVHGIADTAALATKTYADGAVSTAVAALTKSSVGLGNVDNTSDANKPISTATQSALDLKAPLASPTFTGTVSGVTKAMVGLGNADNTSDANKPVSTATQTALDLKAPLAGPTFTGTVTLPSTTSIGNVSATELGYVDGVTSAIQTQLDSKLALAGGTMTGALTLSGAPSADLHAATKAYVDNVTAGINFHQPVRVATTANITLSGTQTIDGVSLSVGDRVLVKDQTTQTQNGIYVVASGSWTRATDADNTPDGELKGGDFTLVLEGTVNSGYGYVCSNTSAITIGTTNVTYAAFNAAKAITAGSGLTESTPGTIEIATGGVTSAMIADGTIVNADINASAAIDQSKISGLSASFAAKADLASPTFTGTVTLPAAGIVFSDGTQSKEGVPSRTPIIQKSAAYTLSALSERDSMIEVSHTGGTAVDITIPANSSVAYPVGTSIDVLRTNTGGVRIVGAAGVTVNGTPGAYLRAQWSAATLFKRATDTWVLIGDLATA
jgi:hypothetical protein